MTRPGVLTLSKIWAKHLRPFWKRDFWKRERRAAKQAAKKDAG